MPTENENLENIVDKNNNLTIQYKKEFAEKYISPIQICRLLNIQKENFRYGQVKHLPEPITIEGVKGKLWVRSQIMPLLKAWKFSLSRKHQ